MSETPGASFAITQDTLLPGPSQITGGSGATGTGATGPSGQGKYMFVGEIENVTALVPVLKAICVKRTTVMAITDRGLKISCEEDSRAVQATAFVDRNLFQKYELRNDIAQTLCFRMSDLLTALSILFPTRVASGDNFLDQSSNVLRIKYENVERLKLQVLNGDHSAMAYIRTVIPDSLVVYSMSFFNKVIVDASCLIDFWKCADTLSPYLHMKISNEDETFEMSTESDRGKFRNKIHANSVHVEHFECTLPMANKYEMGMMKYTVRPLVLASKVSIRMDSQGLLNMQFLVRLDSNPNLADYSTTRPVTARADNDILNQGTPQQAIPISQEVQKCFIEFYVIPSVDID